MDTQQTPVDDSASVLKNLESMIKNSLSEIERKKDELRKLNEMTTSLLSQDPTYQEHEKLAKEALKVKNATKTQLLKQPGVQQSVQKAKGLKSELKDSQGGLSDYLREYEKMSGSNEIEDNDGEVREIVYTARLVKRSSKFK